VKRLSFVQATFEEIDHTDVVNRIGSVIVSVLASNAVDRGFEPYPIRIWITKLRISNITLSIETGRLHAILIGNRICHVCNSDIGNR
jgi:hypothetical protein